MIFAFGLIGLLIAQFVILLLRVGLFFQNHQGNLTDLPLVSILIAVRNEERDLPKLLKSLERIDYPEEKLQFLFADDASSDRSLDLLNAWCQSRANGKVLELKEQEERGKRKVNPKAQALANLGTLARGEFLFFTDADCQVPKTWIKELLTCFEENTGMVLGITQVKGQGIFAKMQEIDWWLTLGLVKIAADLEISTTGLGNNMVIKSKAYVDCGGFEALPFSLTEDLEMSRAIRRAGYSIRSQISPEALVDTKSESSLPALLSQRKRWMSGVMSLDLFWKIALGIQVLYFPALIYLLIFSPQLGLIFGAIKWGLQSLFLRQVANKAGKELAFSFLLLFEIYFVLLSVMTILYYFWPSATKWKSREYS